MFTDVLTVLYVADIERSLRLYRDAFGMAETYRFPRTGVPEHIEVRVGATTLGLSSAAGLASHGMPPLKRGEASPSSSPSAATTSMRRCQGCWRPAARWCASRSIPPPAIARPMSRMPTAIAFRSTPGSSEPEAG